ncbi:MAG TPA: phytanoyl-CoA dioxygenase family protein [Pyrinomonadaceae bacterium]|nr:phytanoyl-CoA dioxygenase family protein [Pyrinomonadaceae bacterium]
MRRIFKDSEHEHLFRRDGYLVLNAFDPAAIKRIEKFYLTNSDQEFTGFHNSLNIYSPEQKATIHKFLAGIFDEYLSKYFDNYKALIATFSVKNPGPNGLIKPHRDWQLCDQESSAAQLWVPLCDTNADNGGLGVFKGSHKLKSTLHGTNLRSIFPISAAYYKYLTFFRIKVGEVLIISTKTIHASGNNTAGGQRAVASMGIIPAEAKPIHYVGDRQNPSTVVELEVDEEFFHHYYISESAAVSPSDNHIVNSAAYRRREFEWAPVTIEDRDILGLYEPGIMTAFRQIKDRVTVKLPSRLTPS